MDHPRWYPRLAVVLLAALAAPAAAAEEGLVRGDEAALGGPALAPGPRPLTWAYLNPRRLFVSPQEAPPLPDRVTGRFDNRYRLKQVEYHTGQGSGRRGSRTDQDVWSYLSMRTTDVGVDGLTGRFAARYAPDLDGHRESSVWTDTVNSEDHPDTFKPYQLYVQHDGAVEGLSLRVGRQPIYLIDWARFDGARFDYTPFRAVQFTGFVGRRVYFWGEAPEKTVFGGAVSVRPLRRTAIHVRDLNHIRNAVEVEIAQGLHDHLTLSAAYGWIQGKPNEFRTSVDGYVPSTATRVRLGYLRNSGRSDDEFVLDYTMIGDPGKDGIEWLKLDGRIPYDDYRLEVQQRLHRNLGLTASYILRDTEASNAEERTWNQDFYLATAGFEVRNLPFDRVIFGATYRYWKGIGTVKAGERESHELLGELAYRTGPASFGVGSIFRTFDTKTPFVEVENRNSLGWRAYLAWDFGRAVTARLEYHEDRDYEDLFPDIDLVRGVVLQVTMKF